MLTNQDLHQLSEKGISQETFLRQIECFKQGFPYLHIEKAATVSSGIMRPSDDMCEAYIARWNSYKQAGKKIVKFVPASGAASRMFKDLFGFLEADYTEPQTDFERFFFNHLDRFAFKSQLEETCQNLHGEKTDTLIAKGNYKAIVAALLQTEGLNYGQLPKGLLAFHQYADSIRTAMEEHLVEAALYAGSEGKAKVHFTVSAEHLDLFRLQAERVREKYEAAFNLSFDISFSLQKPSTDTVAANADNTPFRNEDGTLLFRPGGHGALIENLNDIDADIVFVKNIDNVVPDRLKAETTRWKQILAGMLVDLQEKVTAYVEKLTAPSQTREELTEMLHFLETELSCRNPATAEMSDETLATYLRKKFHRPMRVCGMVRNSGEPGGGPFFAQNADGSVSLQILESSQINKHDETAVRMFSEGTHFNPVDLVCALKDTHGTPYHLPDYVDASTGFISSKSKNGRELKALELPGLWNGAMSDWNTIFVEVPAITFNPVKTVNDLLRDEHKA
ncbi:MAG: DUF4301 family protein [Prevotella sp.]|nr:DUF4301 family protein [Prevotella sp.]MDD7272933.1 DUF4301 family protein [Prevotellaceae bacterium]MDY3935841.1 DUF4301 family protein [Prevotella sp.]